MDGFDFTERFAENVFTDEEMKKRLPEDVYAAYEKCLLSDEPLGLAVADEIAKAMMDWAVEKGATHYTHWFQPMTGVTAEKHDSFLEPCGGGAILKFSGKALVKGEPDASSFPNGGLRATFEARGYTAWDPSSKAFVMDGSLYIPTVFCSYGGESLDKKTPLIKSVDAIGRQALRILRLFGNENVRKVYSTVGAEQEYFLVDKQVYEKRLDLATCGRTLFGAKPPKGQELEDHYFGKIKSRVWKYMADLDSQLWKLGVYAKTKHNEVAPAQHELASVYTTTVQAVDHNQITMSVMKSVANKHGMVALLHEKPFDGVNGSGKHNNWSLSTDTGVNLLEPGDTPAENAQFLVFLTAVIAAVDDYQDLLRISVASAGNDHRLGANEAPPAIVSMFVGEELDDVLKAIENGTAYKGREVGALNIGSAILPKLPKDKTDRNRTSPFAFTGNKFEFRMVGSDMSVADANTVINTAVADELEKIADELEKSKDFKTDLNAVVRRLVTEHKRIIFNGNNYSEEWVAEAGKRGLLNLATAVDAFPYLVRKKNVELFRRQGIFTEAELGSRCEIHFENYTKIVDIEAKTMLQIAKREIVPAVVAFEKDLAKEAYLKLNLGVSQKICFENDLLKKVSELGKKLYDAAEKLEKDLKNPVVGEEYEMAVYRKDVIIADMKEVRKYADGLEEIVGKDYWPFPTYAEILNSVMY